GRERRVRPAVPAPGSRIHRTGARRLVNTGTMSALVALAAAVAVVLVPTTAIWFLRRRYLVVTVRGSSMLPSYRDGERLLVRRRRPGEELRVGQVVVATPPGSPRAPRPTEPHEAGAVSGRTPASGRNVVVRSGG